MIAYIYNLKLFVNIIYKENLEKKIFNLVRNM